MLDRCGECGAPVPPGQSCRGRFETLLALEWQIPDGPGELSHFFAVATYGLQHPGAMNYRLDTLTGLRRAVRDVLEGRAPLEQIRQRARTGARHGGSITRREGDAEVEWGIAEWPITIVDVLPCMQTRDSYAEQVTAWARSVIDVLGVRHPQI